MSVFASIDVGTNSMKLFVGEVQKTADARTTVTPLAEALEITRLGEGLASRGSLSEDAISRNADQLCSFVNQARELGAERIAVAGTMALREATNASVFLERARARCDVELEVLPGEEEARLSFLAVISGLDCASGSGGEDSAGGSGGEDSASGSDSEDSEGGSGRPSSDANPGDATGLSGKHCIFDTGGGSTEFIVGEGREIVERFSVNLGVRAPTEDHLRSDPPSETEVAALRKNLAYELREVENQLETPTPELAALIGMGGTVSTLAAVKLGMTRYAPDEIRGTFLDRDEIERQIALYARLPLSARQEIDGLAAKRADVILAGACIVAAVLDRLGKERLLVSERGLRHGLFYDRFVPAH